MSVYGTPLFDNAVGSWVHERLVSIHEPHQVRRLSFRTAHLQDFTDVFLHADVAALDVDPVTNGRAHGTPSLQPDRRTYFFIGERAARIQVIASGRPVGDRLAVFACEGCPVGT